MSESKQAKRDARRLQILRATLRLLRQHGAGITTAQIAAEANCSKETLYNWFSDRDGIMMALAQQQAQGMNVALAHGFGQSTGALKARLINNATLLLDIMTGEAVLAVNRVAMSQACADNCELGKTVLAEWRDQVAQPFLALFAEGKKSGDLAVNDPDEAFENLTGLLIGDRQRRLLLGKDVRPDPTEMKSIATKAVEQWLVLYQH